VRGLDTGVNNVDAGTGASSAVVGVGSGSLGGVGDATKTPGGGALGHQGALLDLTEAGLDNSILLDGLDLFCVSGCHTRFSIDLHQACGTESRRGCPTAQR
jgi:hypothetical protein